MSETKKDPIKEAFAKAKQDIFSLASEIESLKREIQSLKELVKSQNNLPPSKQTDKQTDNSTHPSTENPAQNTQNQTPQHIKPTEKDTPAHIPAQNQALYSLKTPISNFSIGNKGVPADSQTVRQSVNRQENRVLTELSIPKTAKKIQHIDNQTIQQHTPKTVSKPLESVSQILQSLDTIKKEIRHKFKRLTSQEMAVFSSIYQSEEEGFIVDYPLLAQKLQLTQSSIRDYIQRLLKKGIPIIKNKENNKKIVLSISSELKKIASLSTITQLREL